MSVATLTGNGETIQLDGSPQAHGLILRSLDGWLDSTSAKVDLTERGNGDGAHDILPDRTAYSARTVTIGYRLLAPDAHDRSWLLDQQNRIRRLLHGTVTLRVEDDVMDTYITGYIDSVDVAETVQNINHQTLSGQIIMVCPRPQILSTDAQTGQMMPMKAGEGRGGLSYNQSQLSCYWEGEPNNSVSVLVTDSLVGRKGIRYPLTYQKKAQASACNQITLVNHGSSPAYPVLSVHGPMPNGVDLVVQGKDGSEWLRCTQPVSGEKLVLDCRTRTATVGGTDFSRTLTSRGFPVVPAGGSVTITLRTVGFGWVDVEMHDTWM